MADNSSSEVQYPGWWLDPYRDVLGRLGSAFEQQSGLSGTQNEALQQQRATARAGTTSGAPRALQDILGGPGIDPRSAALGRNLIGGQFVNPAFGETQRIAMGGDVGMNPYLEATYERASRPLLEQLTQQVNPSIDIGAASAGRTGGGLHALLRNQAGQQTGQALTDLSTGIFGGAYESDQARRMGALGQLGQLGQMDVGNRLSGAGLLDQGTARLLQGISMAPGTSQLQYADPSQLYAAGATAQQAPWMAGLQYGNFLQGTPGVSSGYTSSMPSPSPFASALAGGLGGAAIGAPFGGQYAALGAGLGGLAGFFG